MRRQKPKRYKCKGGGGGGGGTGPRIVSASTRKRNRSSTNTVDKFTWNSPPGTKVEFYKGERVKGTVFPAGNVVWTIDDTTEKGETLPRIPARELNDLKKAWKEYLKSPNAKRVFKGTLYFNDGAGQTRQKMYESLGFKVVPSNRDPSSMDVRLDNR